MIRHPSLCVAAAWLLLACASPPTPPAIRAEGAWVRAVPEVVTTTAAYLVLQSSAPHDDLLLSVTTPLAPLVEVHETVRDGEWVEMRPVEGLTVPAGGSVQLAPGGVHLMLIDMLRHPAPGEQIPLSLRFRDAGVVEVQAVVQDWVEEDPHAHHHH